MGIEIINGAFDVYMAPVDETYTDLSQTPAGNWAKIGTSGKRHYGEDGVVLTVNQETANHAFAGGTEVLKVSRTLEEMVVSFTLYDLQSPDLQTTRMPKLKQSSHGQTPVGAAFMSSLAYAGTASPIKILP